MIKKIFTFCIYAFGSVALVLTKLMLVNVFPELFGRIDVLMIFFVISIMRGASGWIVWFAFITYALLDMLTAHAFGVEMVAGMMSVLGVYWFFEDVFTNLSIWTAGILVLFGMTIFRIGYIVLGALFSYLPGAPAFSFSWNLLQGAGIEIVSTALVAVPVYAIVIKLINTWTRERIRYS
jgi:hypothetical protein